MAGNIKICVVDSSFFLCYLMPDEDSPEVQKIFELYKTGQVKFTAVSLLPFEVINGLYTAVLRKRIDKALSQKLAEEFLEFPIELKTVDYSQALTLAHKYSLSVYDASYLTLAQEMNIKLLTLDQKLAKLI